MDEEAINAAGKTNLFLQMTELAAISESKSNVPKELTCRLLAPFKVIYSNRGNSLYRTNMAGWYIEGRRFSRLTGRGL